MHIGNIYILILKALKIPYGKGLQLYGFPIIVKNRNAKIELGQECHIRSGFLTNLVGLSQRSIICAKDEAVIKIGNGVGMSGVTIYAREAITIGDRCVIGGNVKILDNDFHPADPDLRLENPCANYGKKAIVIGNNVFIGCNSLILKGVTIGDNSVVGAGSVVCCSVPENCIVAGNPAHVVKNFRENGK